MLLRIPPNLSPEQLEAAHAAGLLRKDQLQHGTYYEGRCRNASVARWHAGFQCFVHWRTKFGQRYLERIRHPEDERSYDVFLVQRLTEPLEVDVIPDDDFEQCAESGPGG
jgi:hypothetical protein